jgi:hypothetical protein
MAATIWSRASGATSTSADSGSVGAGLVNAVRLDANVSVVTAGSIQFFVEALGADTIWYTLWAGSAIAAPGQLSVSISPSLPNAAGPPILQGGIVPDIVRVRWVVVTGPITFSAQLVGDNV